MPARYHWPCHGLVDETLHQGLPKSFQAQEYHQGTPEHQPIFDTGSWWLQIRKSFQKQWKEVFDEYISLILWIFMNFYEFLWIFMNFYEFLWIFMNLSEFLWISMNFYEFLWIFMNFMNFYEFYKFYEFLWIFMNSIPFVFKRKRLMSS